MLKSKQCAKYLHRTCNTNIKKIISNNKNLVNIYTICKYLNFISHTVKFSLQNVHKCFGKKKNILKYISKYMIKEFNATLDGI